MALKSRSLLLTIVTTLTLFPPEGWAETPSPSTARLRLSVADAVEAALVRSYMIRLAQVDDRIAGQRIRGALSAVLPQLDAFATYDRTFLTPNPFAGSDAAEIFGGLGTGDWIAYNERARSDGDGGLRQAAVVEACGAGFVGADGTLGPVSFGQYVECVSRRQDEVRTGPGPSPDDNPFLVENNVRFGLSGSQLLYSGAAFAGLRAAELAGQVSQSQLERTGQQVVRDATSAYYAVLLAQASVEVLDKSVERARATAEEVRARVREGVVPQFQQLSSEVELANLETQLVSARDQAESAEDTLAVVIGVPVGTELVLTDRLALPDPLPEVPTSVDAATRIAFEARPDLDAAERSVELRRAAKDATFARYLPELRLVANLSVVGNVPDDRERLFVLPAEDSMELLTDNPFGYGVEQRGIFDDAFWGTNFTAGLSLSWNLFDGFATSAQYAEDDLEIRRAKVQLELLEEQVRQEVSAERRRLASALERVEVQAQNVKRAELNYRHAERRGQEDVSVCPELRGASSQLDQSRFNRLQAVHDFLVAWTSFEVAIGRPPFERQRGEENSP